MTLYHIVTTKQWQEIQKKEYYTPLSLEREGFIHLSTLEQTDETIKIYFPENEQVILLKIQLEESDPNLKWEYSSSRQADFPHYYSKIETKKLIKLKK